MKQSYTHLEECVDQSSQHGRSVISRKHVIHTSHEIVRFPNTGP